MYAVNKADCFAVQTYGETTSSSFIAHFLQSQSAYKQVERQIHGVGRPRINTTQLKEVLLPICTLEEQTQIVRRLEAKLSTIDALEAELDVQLLRANALRQSILKRAFSGKLVPQDPTDEPASVLLERIKAERADAAQKKESDGNTRRRRKPKTRRPMMADLIEILKKGNGWVSATKAAQSLGVSDGTSSDDVEEFYRNLRQYVVTGAVQVDRRDDEDWLRLVPAEAT